MSEKNLERLRSVYIDGKLSPREAAELTDCLRKDPEAREAFLEDLEITGLLRQLTVTQEVFLRSFRERVRVGGSGASIVGPVTRKIRETRRGESVRKTRRWGSWLSVAACMVIIAGSLVYNHWRATQFGEVLVAHIKATAPGVRIIRRGETIIAVLDMPLFAGDRIVTEPGKKARFVYEGEQTEILINENTILDVGGVEKGKRLRLEKGMIDASVVPQPADKAFVVETPHARAKIVGTVFSLCVAGSATWLNVKEGSVELMRLDDGKVTLVEAGLLAVAGASAKDFALTRYPAGTKYVDGPVVFSDDFEAGMDRWKSFGMRKEQGDVRSVIVGTAPATITRVSIGGIRSRVVAVSEAEGVESVSVVIPKIVSVLETHDAFSVEFDVMRDRARASYLFSILDKMGKSTSLFKVKDPITHGEWHHIRLEIVKTGSKGGVPILDVKCFSGGGLLIHDLMQTTSLVIGGMVENGTLYIDNYVLRGMVSVAKGTP